MSPLRAESEINRRSDVRSSLLYQYETAATNRQVVNICIPGISFIWCTAPYSDRQSVYNYIRWRQDRRDNTDCPDPFAILVHARARALKWTDASKKVFCNRVEQFSVVYTEAKIARALRRNCCDWQRVKRDRMRSCQWIDLPINSSQSM